MATQKIIPNLWFDKEAKEAAEFYVAAFGADSKVGYIAQLHNTPSGDTDIVTFKLWGHEFMAVNGGPQFKINPSISFFVNFDPARGETKDGLQALWDKLANGGKVLMELGEYPFSKYYGWVQDKYGLSWQLILADSTGDPRPRIMPSLLFTGANCGKAAEAIDFYLSVFKNSSRGILAVYQPGQAQTPNAKTAYADVMLENYWLALMDSGVEQSYSFNEAVSLAINCQDQEEIDYYWEKLSAVPEAEQCGWLKDKYGVSWQVQPEAINQMLSQGSPEQIERITQALLKMKKFDLAELNRVYQG